jgi:hypothetical protein
MIDLSAQRSHSIEGIKVGGAPRQYPALLCLPAQQQDSGSGTRDLVSSAVVPLTRRRSRSPAAVMLAAKGYTDGGDTGIDSLAVMLHG